MLFLLIASTGLVFAQQFEGSIVGTVKDSSGAVVNQATVTAVNSKTAVAYATKSNDVGDYAIMLLPIGTYKLQVQAVGFNATSLKVDVHGGDRLQINPVLVIGNATETVTVEANGLQLETANADSSTTIDSVALHNMPTFGQNPLNLIQFSAGATNKPSNNGTASLRPFDNGGMDSFMFNGSVLYTNDVTLDGLTDTGSEQATYSQIANVNIVPSPEMLEESNIQTSVYDAQYGRSGGGFMSMNLKSGGNQFHGAFRDYVRNSMFNANDYANNHQKAKRPNYHWSQPGLVVTGPIYIPKLYNGRNKTFFMFGWEDVRSSTPSPIYSSVPMDLERGGNFSQSIKGSAQAIYDPLTTVQVGSKYTRTAFANSQLTRFDPVALKIMALIPHANVPGAYNTSNYFSGSNMDIDRYDEFVYRVDQSIHDNHHLAFTYIRSDRHEYRSGAGWPLEIAPDYSHYRSNYGAHVNWNWTIKPNLLSAFGIGWNEHGFSQAPMVANYDLSKIGLGTVFSGTGAASLFPFISPGTYSSFGSYSTSSSNTTGVGTGHFNINDNYDLRETLFYTLNHHTISVGGEVRPMRDRYKWGMTTSAFLFTKQYSQADPQTADSASGNAYADFLMGYPNSASYVSNPELNYKDGYFAAFIQDMWRFNNKLTVTLGLRWDTESPMTDSYQNVGFNEDARYNFAGQALKGTVLFDTNSGRKRAYDYDLNNFGPRVGFAYAAKNSFVVRGGIGILYTPTFDAPSSYGYSATTSMVTTSDGGLTPSTSTTLSNPYPSGFTTAAGANTNLNGQGGWWYWDKNTRKVPRVIQTSIGFEWQVPHLQHARLDVHYVGQWSQYLPIRRNVNFTSTANWATYGSKLASTVTNPFYGYVPGTSMNSATYTLEQSLKPYPQYAAFNKVYSNGENHYHGLQAHFEKRTSNGLYGMASYTYSKNMDHGFLNDQDTELTSYISVYDVPQKLTIVTGYQLPFFANGGNALLRNVAGGWATDLTFSAQSGYLYSAPTGVQTTGIDPHIANPTPDHMFNTCTITTTGTLSNCTHETTPAWSITPAYTLTKLNPYYGGFRVGVPPSVNLAFAKTFKLGRGTGLNIRGEAFNLTNSTEFRAPDVSATSSTFGARTNFTAYNMPRNVQLSARVSF